MKNFEYREKERGSAYIEAAIVLPVLFFLIFGIINFSMVMWADGDITNALADAARSAEVLDLTSHAKRRVVANVLMKSLRRYKTPISSLYCNSRNESCPGGGFAKIRMEWIHDNGAGLYQAIQNSHTVRDVFYNSNAADENQSPQFNNAGHATPDSALGNGFLGNSFGLIGISVMFRPECRVCKYLLGRDLQYRRTVFVPYQGTTNPFAYGTSNGCNVPIRTCLVNTNDGTLIPDGGVVCGTCTGDANY